MHSLPRELVFAALQVVATAYVDPPLPGATARSTDAWAFGDILDPYSEAEFAAALAMSAVKSLKKCREPPPSERAHTITPTTVYIF